jgi:hypothetical protein
MSKNENRGAEMRLCLLELNRRSAKLREANQLLRTRTAAVALCLKEQMARSKVLIQPSKRIA